MKTCCYFVFPSDPLYLEDHISLSALSSSENCVTDWGNGGRKLSTLYYVTDLYSVGRTLILRFSDSCFWLCVSYLPWTSRWFDTLIDGDVKRKILRLLK